jgi:UDP-2,3-diacylglucosamine pyrophosphatase LpxH
VGFWIDLVKAKGNYYKAADSVGLAQSTVWHQAQAEDAVAKGKEPKVPIRTLEEMLARSKGRRGLAPDFGLTREVPDGLDLAGVSISYDKDGEVSRYSQKMVLSARSPAESTQLPTPGKITKISTNYNKLGEVTSQWVQEKPEDIQREAAWETFARALSQDLPRADPIEVTDTKNADLCSCYVISDHHLGMYSWKLETGADYDIPIAESLLDNAIKSLVDSAPHSETALVVVLGDFLHYDSNEAVTPAHKNLLDADGRAQKMVEAAVRSLRRIASRVRTKHKKVRFIFEPGNHDPYSIMFLRVMFSVYFENDPNVSVDNLPGNFHYFEFGNNLVGTHHGHSAKMDRLPGIMAHDQGPAWGRTKYRTWWTGHIHHEQIKEFPGCTVESFGILAAPDAYAASHGYRSKRSMKAIVLHKEHGEVERHTVNPDMFE